MTFDKSLLFRAYNVERAITSRGDKRTDLALAMLQRKDYRFLRMKYRSTAMSCRCKDRIITGAVCKHMRAERIREMMISMTSRDRREKRKRRLNTVIQQELGI